MELISAFSVETILEFQVIRRLISVKTTSKARDNAALFVRRGLKAGNFEMTTPDKEEMPTDMTAAKLIRWPDTANIGVTEANGDIVWWAQISTLNPNTSVADLRNVADRIVTACNAYEPTREALKPFADELNDYPVDIDGSTRIWDCKIRVRDLRNAAAAYAALSTLPVNDRQTSDDVGILRDAARRAHDTLIEINQYNYTHADVCELNDASVEAILILADAIGERHGKTEKWWNDRRAALKGVPQPASDDYQADASAPALSEKVNVRSESRDER